MTNHPPLNPGSYYHIYNRANGTENLFREDANYIRFLELYDRFISPVADTLAWVLMGNHFHLLVYIKEGMYYKYSKEDFSSNQTGDGNADRFAQANAVGLRFEDVKWETTDNLLASDNPLASERPDGVNGSDGVSSRKKANPTNHFSHLFNAYAKYINDKYDRHGSLFQRPFRRKPVEDEYYLQQVVLYIHNNPVHHGFVSHPKEYPWSSYHTFLSPKSTRLQRNTVLGWFEGANNFTEIHSRNFDHVVLERWLDMDENEVIGGL